MFSVAQKRKISSAIQALLRETGHPELPNHEITFTLYVKGAESWSFATIRNNGDVDQPTINQWNEAQDAQN